MMATRLTRFEINDVLSELWADSTTHERREILQILDDFLTERHHYGSIGDLKREHELKIYEMDLEHGREIDRLSEQLERAKRKHHNSAPETTN